METMGHWSSVDRIEIESMRSVRNIISEYLASPGRPRPLNLAVFGPPGSGKSFAIKQMASVIAPERNRLGSLEFNLSQFQDCQLIFQMPCNRCEISDCANFCRSSSGMSSTALSTVESWAGW